MINFIEREEFKDFFVNHYDKGFLIVSTIKMENGKSNYDVPITLAVSNSFGCNAIHGLTMKKLWKLDIDEYVFNQGLLLMNSSNNWIVFIPKRNALKFIQPDQIKIDLEKEFKSELSPYFTPDWAYIREYDLENSHTSFTYGLGVD